GWTSDWRTVPSRSPSRVRDPMMADEADRAGCRDVRTGEHLAGARSIRLRGLPLGRGDGMNTLCLVNRGARVVARIFHPSCSTLRDEEWRQMVYVTWNVSTRRKWRLCEFSRTGQKIEIVSSGVLFYSIQITRCLSHPGRRSCFSELQGAMSDPSSLS